MPKKRKIEPEAIPQFLEMLECEEIDAQTDALSALCPCRSKCYDKDIWAAVCRAFDDSASSEQVMERAFHALETLVEVARTDADWREVLNWLIEKGLLTLPLEKPGPPRKKPAFAQKRAAKVTSQDVPRLLETLACADPHAQKDALQLLCPCRNRRYDQELWLAICRAYQEGDTGGVRDQAGHAIETLRQRARTDPRSQKLVLWLTEQGALSLPLDRIVPEWQPTGRAGLNSLYIPRFERSPRSKANRRR